MCVRLNVYVILYAVLYTQCQCLVNIVYDYVLRWCQHITVNSVLILWSDILCCQQPTQLMIQCVL